MSGYKSYSAIAEWGRNYGKEIALALRFKEGKTPCVGTLNWVFRNINIESLERVLGEYFYSYVEEVRTWQTRPLDAVYPIVYLDAIQGKVHTKGKVNNKAIYLAIGVNLRGYKEVLGMWASENQGARFWLSIVTELKNRGVKDIFLACIDGLKGFPEAIEAVFPKTQIQLCIIHVIRNSLAYVSYKDLKKIVLALKLIYQAVTETDAEIALELFQVKQNFYLQHFVSASIIDLSAISKAPSINLSYLGRSASVAVSLFLKASSTNL